MFVVSVFYGLQPALVLPAISPLQAPLPIYYTPLSPVHAFFPVTFLLLTFQNPGLLLVAPLLYFSLFSLSQCNARLPS